ARIPVRTAHGDLTRRGLDSRGRRRQEASLAIRQGLSSMEALFCVDGKDVVTSPHAAGPWDPSMQHGSPPAALVVWAAEKIPTQVAMRVARVTVDLMRPVPVAPLTVESEVLREGRKIQLCAVRLLAQGVVVVSATVLKIKVQGGELPPEAVIEQVTLPGPEQSR